MSKAFTCKRCGTFNPERPEAERGVCSNCGCKRPGRVKGSKNQPKAELPAEVNAS